MKIFLSAYISTVIGFNPAPGQFVNEVPEIAPDASPQQVVEAVAKQICGAPRPGLISLGAFGGNVTFAFDHPVINVPGEKDFVIYGNSMSNGAEPGIIMVSRDENGNGIPDDPWYELAGSEEKNPKTRFNYTITYHRPVPENTPTPDPDRKFITDLTYIYWEAEEVCAFMPKLASHTQSYWPQWDEAEELTFTGTCLPSNSEDINGKGTNYKITTYEWGYVDNQPNSAETGFDLSNAVDADRNPVNLPSVDFFRVYTAVNDFRGWLGECSTEIAGGEDLHPEATLGLDLTPRPRVAMQVIGRVLRIVSDRTQSLRITGLDGHTVMEREIPAGTTTIDLSALNKGIYLAVCSKIVKFVL